MRRVRGRLGEFERDFEILLFDWWTAGIEDIAARNKQSRVHRSEIFSETGRVSRDPAVARFGVGWPLPLFITHFISHHGVTPYPGVQNDVAHESCV